MPTRANEAEKKKFAENLKKLRQILENNEIASRLDMSPTYSSKLYSGDAKPGRETIDKFNKEFKDEIAGFDKIKHGEDGRKPISKEEMIKMFEDDKKSVHEIALDCLLLLTQSQNTLADSQKDLSASQLILVKTHEKLSDQTKP